ncbi:hypothetical protein ABT294_24750 [Nonomuraea sp. NPDC000554]|uniref:hypothetical protein n=1 Tax=Nonomuraea sp. NPDC000554 TaxID=3154259 RepID=UPI00332B8A2A
MSRVLTAVLLLSLLVAGCAQRDERHPLAIAIAGTPAAAASAAPKASAAATVDPNDALLKLAQCLRQNGIDVPDPGSPEEKTWQYKGDQATLQKAVKACEKFAAQIPNPMNDPKTRDELVKFARCMREQGIDVPDPPQQNTGLDPNDPKFQKAAEACAKLLPSQGGTQ